MTKSQARLYRQTHKRTRKMENSQKIVLWLMVVATIVVIFALAVFAYFYSDNIVKNRLGELAKIYYEEYYYNSLTNYGTDNSTLKEYNETGLPTVNLRQLLTFDNHKYANLESDFVNSRYSCDLTNTSVKYYPVEPYSAQDYTVKYRYSCSHLSE